MTLAAMFRIVVLVAVAYTVAAQPFLIAAHRIIAQAHGLGHP